MAYTVFDSVNMGSTHYAERIFDAVADVDVENGTFGYLEELATGELVTYKFIAGIDKEGLGYGDIVVVDQPAWTEDTSRRSNQRRDKFIIPAGTRFRVRVVKKNDEFGISIDGFAADAQETVAETADYTEDPVLVTIDDNGKLAAYVEGETDDVFIGQIMRKRLMGAKLVTVAATYGYDRYIYEVKVISLA